MRFATYLLIIMISVGCQSTPTASNTSSQQATKDKTMNSASTQVPADKSTRAPSNQPPVDKSTAASMSAGSSGKVPGPSATTATPPPQTGRLTPGKPVVKTAGATSKLNTSGPQTATVARNPQTTVKHHPVVARPSSKITVNRSSNTKSCHVAKKYFWHGAWHATPHPANCQDLKWHPYLKASPEDSGDPEKYRLLDAQSEEVDVSTYPPDLQATYREIIRDDCVRCHSPARCLHRRYTPRQWKSALILLKSRYNLSKEQVVRLYKFFVYHEERMLQQGEE